MKAWCVLVIIVGLAGFASLSAATATIQVKTTVDQVLEILNDLKLRGEAMKKERRERLRNAISPRFDFGEMAKRSLGHHWRRYPEKQEEFVSAFTDYLEATYLKLIESYKGEKILYKGERLDNDFAEVDTKVISDQGTETPITYKLHLVAGEWKVYDFVVEGVSLVNNYRSQFDRILANSSFDEMLKALRKKTPGKS